MFLTACRKDAKACFPSQLTDTYRLEGATSSTALPQAVTINISGYYHLGIDECTRFEETHLYIAKRCLKQLYQLSDKLETIS